VGTIIAVHGTGVGANGPPDGNAWWQAEGILHKDLNNLIISTRGDLVFESLVWDGKNSETSRYNAGEQLYARICQLEVSGQDYCLIGHSHGGSVLQHALQLASFRKRDLGSLRQWITVGTPFIEIRKRFLLFSRLGDRAQAAYFIFAYCVIAYLAFLISVLLTSASVDNRIMDMLFCVLGAMVLAAVYIGLRSFQPSRLKLLGSQASSAFRFDLAKKWLPLWHADDEAMQGLRLVKEIRLSPFDPRFAVPMLSFLSLPILLVIMFWISNRVDYSLFADPIAKWVGFHPTPETNIDGFQRFARNTLSLVAFPSRYLFQWFQAIGLEPGQHVWFNHSLVMLTLVVSVLIGAAAFWLVSIVLTVLFAALAMSISRILSSIFNFFTNQQIIKLSLGGDALGASAISAQSSPSWTSISGNRLPEALSEEITAVSNLAAAQSIGKFRAALSTVVFSEQTSDVGELVANYLTWHELIHTNYFRAAGFRKLMAYAISQNEGFAVTDEFKQNPDYKVVAEWYDTLVKATPQ
jgi:hypothetical protein